jgi:hypothetical protein
VTEWIDLDRELAAWERVGRTATFWWRDDDAITLTPGLQRLVDLAGIGEPSTPLALAVIPARADAALAQALSVTEHVAALQHGYAHANQATTSGKKAEFGVGRDAAAALRDLREGAERMRTAFGDRALPVLVPPWNRIDPALAGRLGDLGFRGLSTYGPRATASTEAGVTIVNTHVDIIDWHGGRRFLGVEGCLQLAVSHLAARRESRVDPDEPTGLLTHHLVHDEDAWSFLEAFLQRTKRHPSVCWMDAGPLFGCSRHRPA